MKENSKIKYIDKLNMHIFNEYTSKIYEYGLDNNVPVMEINGLANIVNLINILKIENILEIGCAISASSHVFASCESVKHIDTIERDPEMIKLAKDFINSGDKKNIIHLIEGDALLIDNTVLLDKYDLIIFDAAKVQNIKFFEKYESLLKVNGLIITDNILFHGCVENQNGLTKNVLNMAKKLDEYNHYCISLENYEKVFLPVGDGQAILRKVR